MALNRSGLVSVHSRKALDKATDFRALLILAVVAVAVIKAMVVLPVVAQVVPA